VNVEPSLPERDLVLGIGQPNPFNSMTTLRYSLPEPGPVRLSVWDVAGRLIRTLFDGHRAAGGHEATWDGVMEDGHGAPSGTYFCRLTTPWGMETRKLALVR
jgi:hypothetical protein